ncbi:hypothetical protein [Sorangium sp. So ce388]|uniref:hypothetical protein n=1 Tax=Sorangium sp. So ce388 TaxID=3133309 RepID=UPI003F5C6B08
MHKATSSPVITHCIVSAGMLSILSLNRLRGGQSRDQHQEEVPCFTSTLRFDWYFV